MRRRQPVNHVQIIDRVGSAWGFTAKQRREARLRAAKDRLNALTARLLSGDGSVAIEAELAQHDVEQIQAETQKSVTKKGEHDVCDSNQG